LRVGSLKQLTPVTKEGERDLARPMVEGATFVGPLPAPYGAFLYLFRREERDLLVGWSAGGGVRATLPRPAAAVVSRDGLILKDSEAEEIDLGPSPTYFHLR